MFLFRNISFQTKIKAVVLYGGKNPSALVLTKLSSNERHLPKENDNHMKGGGDDYNDGHVLTASCWWLTGVAEFSTHLMGLWGTRKNSLFNISHPKPTRFACNALEDLQSSGSLVLDDVVKKYHKTSRDTAYFPRRGQSAGFKLLVQRRPRIKERRLQDYSLARDVCNKLQWPCWIRPPFPECLERKKLSLSL